MRRCHGDLHLGNIVLLDGEPVLFDAIEFDPAIATGDVLYDLAFLLMDLIERGLTPAANIVLNRYLNETRRDGGSRCARGAAAVHVAARGDPRQGHGGAAGARWRAQDDRAERARLFRARATLLRATKPTLVAVGGLSGTGKSLLARALAAEILPEPGAVWLRSDVERKALFGVAETDRLPETAYARDVTAQVYAALGDKARRVLAAGHSAIVDAVFANADERTAIAQQQLVPAPRFHGLFLTADLATRLARVGGRKGDASDADAAVARAQEQYDLGAIDWLRSTPSGTPAETAAPRQKRRFGQYDAPR